MEKQPCLIFAYGTLLNDEVTEAVLGRAPHGKKGTLIKHRRLAIKGKVYPAMVPSTSASDIVSGKVYSVSPDELKILDAFEDRRYERAEVEVAMPVGERVRARAYVRSQNDDSDLESDWDYKRFLRDHLTWYVHKCRLWAQKHKASSSNRPANLS